MKKIFLIVGAAFLSLSTFAQSAVTQGNFIIDPYIGVPNWANSIFYNNYDGTDQNVQRYTVNGGMLSYGGRFEYMIAENMGLGLDANYEVSGFNYDYDKYDTTTLMTYTYNLDFAAKKTRVMARMNYHFVQNDRVDVYAGFAGGYKYVSRTVRSTEPNYNDQDLSVKGALIPVAIRLSIGTRVYFTQNIGAMIELGAFGGGLLQFGLSAKF